MPTVAIVYGLLLLAIGLGGYFGTGAEHKTALIPAVLGVIALVLGFLARKEHLLKHTMHAAALLGLIAIGGTFRGLVTLIKSFGGTELARPEATYAQAATCVLSIIFLVLCVNSFIQVRRARRAAAAAGK